MSIVWSCPLRELLARARSLLRRERGEREIAQRAWPFDFTAMSNVIDVYVGTLRRKLGDNEEPRLLGTVRGTGDMLRDYVQA